MTTHARLPLVLALFCTSVLPGQCPAEDEFECDVSYISPSGTYYDARGRLGLDLRDNQSGRWYDYEAGSSRWYGISWEAAGGNTFYLRRFHKLQDGTSLTYVAIFTQEESGDMIYVDWHAYHEGQDVTAECRKLDYGIALTLLGAYYPFDQEVGERYSKRR